MSRFSNMSFKARLALVAAGAVALAVIAASAVVFLVVRNELRCDFDNGLRTRAQAIAGAPLHRDVDPTGHPYLDIGGPGFGGGGVPGGAGPGGGPAGGGSGLTSVTGTGPGGSLWETGGGSGPGGGGPGGSGPGGPGGGSGGPGGSGPGAGGSTGFGGGSGSGSGGGGGTGSGAPAGEGTSGKWLSASAMLRSATISGGGLSGAGAGGQYAVAEEDVRSMLTLFAQLGKSRKDPDAKMDAPTFQSRLSALPVRAQFTLQQALAGLAAQAPTEAPDKPMLLKLAEHVAIRFALDSYERGELRVNAVKQLLDRMNTEIEALRKILGQQQDQMASAGISMQSYTELLDQEFWQQVPDENKKEVLCSDESWCVPPRNVRGYLEEMLRRGELKTVNEILMKYASCIGLEAPEARRTTAIGLGELAELYGSGDGSALIEAIRHSRYRVHQLQGQMPSTWASLPQKSRGWGTSSRLYSGF